jgi:multidrug efflux pump subunit AcrA (membrane-fusion protein)
MKIKVSNRMKVLMKKKASRIILILVLCGVAAILVSSALRSNSATVPQYQVVTVQRGNLTVDITASGNLALSKCEDLAFEMKGTVAEVAVAEGDSVKQGQVLATLDTSEWDSELITLESNLLQAELARDNAEEQTTDPKVIKLKKLQVEQAKAALAEARNASPEITAPFDGFITKVNVLGGDEVTKGTVAVTLADPNKFEVDILVSEMDIYQVEVGGTATVQADAISRISLPANVTHIAPTATIQSGVVNYKVTVEVQSLEPITSAQQTGQSAASDSQSPPSGFTPPEGFTPPAGQGSTSTNRTAAIPETIQLREGLTVTVSIIVAQRNDVLLVPYAAITTQGGQSYIQVISSTGTTEKRAIKTGITDYVKTEVTEGLSEGEKVIVSQGTTTINSTTSQQGPPGGTFFFGR